MLLWCGVASTSGGAMARMSVRILSAILYALPCLADTWYVHSGNLGGVQDGKAWTSAFATIQPAIDAAHKAGGGEVWVATGLYGEPRSYREDGIETGALVVRDGVSLYGGFAGYEERRAIRVISRSSQALFLAKGLAAARRLTTRS